MSSIILQIPSGKKCEGCMFLKLDLTRDIAQCNLFNCMLDCRKNWGDIDTESIAKCAQCPKGD